MRQPAVWMVLLLAAACSQPPLTTAAAHRAPRPHAPAREGGRDLRLTDPVSPALALHVTRNVFAYEEAPPVRTRSATSEAAEQRLTTVAAALPTTPPPAPRDPARAFPYRCIGRFGTADAPLAAFVRDGEVLLVRAGGLLGEEFVVRSIGVESVEVTSIRSPQASFRVPYGALDVVQG